MKKGMFLLSVCLVFTGCGKTTGTVSTVPDAAYTIESVDENTENTTNIKKVELTLDQFDVETFVPNDGQYIVPSDTITASLYGVTMTQSLFYGDLTERMNETITSFGNVNAESNGQVAVFTDENGESTIIKEESLGNINLETIITITNEPDENTVELLDTLSDIVGLQLKAPSS